MQPILDRVLVRPSVSEEITTGGIFVPESYREVNNKVTVVAVGNGRAKIPMQFKIGDIAFRVKDNGDEFIINGERHFLMPQSYLIAKLN